MAEVIKEILKSSDKSPLKGEENIRSDPKHEKGRRNVSQQSQFVKKNKIRQDLDPDEEYFSGDTEVSSHDEIDNSHDDDWDEEDDGTIYKFEDYDPKEDAFEEIKPRFLKECLDLLRSDSNDEDSSYKREACLMAIPDLVRQMPPDLPDYANPITRALLHLEDKFGLETFTELRYGCLLSLVCCEPLAIIDYLRAQTFDENISLVTRIDALKIIEMASFELNGKYRDEDWHLGKRQR